MQNNIVIVNKPKNRTAALNQGVYIQEQISKHQKRKENIIMNMKNAQAKIEKLTVTLKELESQLNKVDSTQSNWEQNLKELQLEFSLVEGEILAHRNELLRQKIENLRKEANISATGQSEKF